MCFWAARFIPFDISSLVIYLFLFLYFTLFYEPTDNCIMALQGEENQSIRVKAQRSGFVDFEWKPELLVGYNL
jgi:hypothetical protein